MKNPSSTSLEKSMFPRLLGKLIKSISERGAENIKSGRRTCGIVSLNREAVLTKIPSFAVVEQPLDKTSPVISNTLLEYLQASRRGGEKPTKDKKISIPAGKSVSLIDLDPNLDMNKAGPSGTKTIANSFASSKIQRTPVRNSNCRGEDETNSDITESLPSLPKKVRKSHKKSEKENYSSDNNDSEEGHMSLHDSSETGDIHEIEINNDPSVNDITEGSFVIAKFKTNKREMHKLFVARVFKIYENKDFQVSCLRTKDNTIFVYPLADDICDIDLTQIVAVLPDPLSSRRDRIEFGINISPYMK